MEEFSDKTPLLPTPYSPTPVNDAYSGPGLEHQPISSQATDVKDFYTFNFRGGRSFTIRSQKLNVILTVLTILTNLMMFVTLPLLNNTVNKYNDYYPVLLYSSIWFQPFFFGLVFLNKYINPLAETKSSVSHKVMALLGLLNSINGVLVVYGADPRRTSGSLQALLSTASIPFTVIFRFILLRKGVGRGRLVCTGIVLIGLFIALEPEIFNIGGPTEPVAGAVTGVMKVIWPIIFLLGFLPLGILNVLIERELKKDQTESLVFLAWVQLYNGLFIALLFWTDFIPSFGAAENINEFGRNMLYALKCMYFADSTCMTAAAAYFVFIISYCLANLMVFLLVKYAEGAIWLVLVQALVTPLGSLFFTLFSVAAPPGQHGKFHWAPNFDLAVAFRFVGLFILVPTVIFYNYFGEMERRRAQQQIMAAQETEK
ncbi:uncharacterized protein LOC110984752 [Acanthaster planci]|uniref:Uncharacterized protein LOC110984752 n=1 Tax=Acanthaster planci TaxID=133434 RepID=A0A8B7ZCL5_ACAPL|nr:uncharacterized protein LOC110984752 [Acanthaster planci]XP_022100931.1 uncharacterized protein LOC110984752 [Acanthaster planci]XP_022100940.1 uncharacterized protein LOC110984752 [Acanthaster planci]